MSKITVGFLCSMLLGAGGLVLRWNVHRLLWPSIISETDVGTAWRRPDEIYQEISLFLIGTACLIFAATFTRWLFADNRNRERSADLRVPPPRPAPQARRSSGQSLRWFPFPGV